MFPDVLPQAWRLTAVTVATLAALVIAATLARDWPRAARSGFWIFIGTVAASWWLEPAHDALGLRHFAGIGVGVLAAALCAAWCSTERRLFAGATALAGAAAAILVVGLAGTTINTDKFLGVIRSPAMGLPAALPGIKLGLPGLEDTGHVNANALAGTAILLLPVCAGLAASALRSRPRRRVALLAGGISAALAALTLTLTLSRTALLAAPLTAIVLALRWRRRRWWILGGIALVAGAAYLGALKSRAADPYDFEQGLILTHRQYRVRAAVWNDGIERLRDKPWLGVGINQFHKITPTTDNFGNRSLPHVHNVVLQVALDVGLVGLTGYALLFGTVLWLADRRARAPGAAATIAAGAGLSLVAVHFFGIADTIALGAKVGLFQWWCAGLVIAAGRLDGATPRSPKTAW